MAQFRMWIGTLNNPEHDPSAYLEAWVNKAKAVFATG